MSTPETAIDPNQTQRAAADPDVSAWVAASAGTGKTKVLTDRVLALLLRGARPQSILCLTFTKAAAAEMSNRIAEQLSHWTALSEDVLDGEIARLTGQASSDRLRARARRLFAQVLETPGGMPIETLHAFCQSVLRRFPLEAGLPPHFQVMDDRDAQELLADARDAMLLRARQGRDPLLSQALETITARLSETLFPDVLRALTNERGRLDRVLRARGGVAGVMAVLRRRLGLAAEDTSESLTAAICQAAAFDELGLRLVVEALHQGSDSDCQRAGILEHWLNGSDAQRHEQLPDYLRLHLTGLADGSGPRIKAERNRMTKAARQAVDGAMEIFQAEAERLLHFAEKQRAAITAEATEALLRLAEALLVGYHQGKQRRALLDYDDLILRTRDLLQTPGRTSWVHYKLDGGLSHVLIDEAQDTNWDQWAVIKALTEEFFVGQGVHGETRTVFAVGDAKQSIYSFQRADPAAFRGYRGHFAGRVAAAQQQWREVPMTVSFRSTEAVLAAVDAVFADSSAADGVIEAEDGALSHQAFRRGDGGQVELWPLVTPRGVEDPAPWKPPVERIAVQPPVLRLADLLARRIARMIAEGEVLESKGRAIRPGDIMILVRRRNMLVDALVRALKESGIPVAGVDRMVLTDQLAVMDLIALGRFALLPEDDLTLACVLKSPLIGLSEERLFDLAYDRAGSLWQALGQRHHEAEDFATAHARLSEARREADFDTPFAWYARLLGEHGGRQRLLARLGPEAEDPISEFLDQALVYERNHAPSLEGFLHWLEHGSLEIKRDLEQSTRDVVRVMTVHGAKGLQAPIVFLPDTVGPPRSPVAPFYWLDEAEAEGEVESSGESAVAMPLWPPAAAFRDPVACAAEARRKTLAQREARRLLYVALTRAEDRLYVCGHQGSKAPPEDCWYNLVRNGLEQLATISRQPDPFLVEADETEGNEILRLTCPQQRAAKASVEAATPEMPLGLPDWARCPPPTEPTPPRPLSPSRPEAEPSIRSPLGPGGGDHFLRGRLIHRLLETLPDLPEAERTDAARRWLARPTHGLTRTEQRQIAEETVALLADPDFAAVFGPGSQAEVALTGLITSHDGTEHVVSGQIDRLVVEAKTITVVDFKTHRPPPQQPDRVAPVYLRQMATYQVLLRQIYPDHDVRCALLWTDAPHLMALPDALLVPYRP